jgi:putative beta-lysine N-acetyltransferase
VSAIRDIVRRLADERPDEPYAVSDVALPFGRGPTEAKIDWHNRRLKLIGLAPDDLARADLDLIREALDESRCDKAIVYAYPGAEELLAECGYQHEADLDGWFVADVDAQVWSLITAEARRWPRDPDAMRAIVEAAAERPHRPTHLDPEYRIRRGEVADVPAVGALLRTTFPDYPTPLDDAFLERVIDAGSSRFALVEHEADGLVATISAELNVLHDNAEISDCVTVPTHRGKGIMRFLARHIAEAVSRERKIHRCYTLCRALETGVNYAFADAGYGFKGHLVNNCRMPDGWETTNAWCLRTV